MKDNYKKSKRKIVYFEEVGNFNKIMEDKYYTPKIEEFHVGFECERVNIENAQWGKWVIKDIEELSECPSYLSIEGHLDAEFIRVKYLDKEDIESLGFTFIGKTIDNWFILNTDFKLGGLTYRHITLRYGEDNLLVVFGNEYESEKTVNDEVLFRGYIKNKNELKKLMKQLNIK